MGISKQTLEMLLHENRYKAISGNFLCTGKQTVHVDYSHAVKLFHKYGLPTDNLENYYISKKFDTLTKHANETILDNDLLSCFSDATYNCLDRSSYEGATIIHDMNTPIPKNLHEQFDFIYNGSCMDNVFDPVSFIRNTSDMLKVGGRILHVECASGFPGAYLMYSPEWFFSYYAVNNFIYCNIYVIIAGDEGISAYTFDTDLFVWQPFFTRTDNYKYIEACKTINGSMYVIVLAEKGKKSTGNLSPVQMQYLDENSVDWRQQYYLYKKSGRPLIKPDHKNNDVVLPYLSDHYKYLGGNF